MDAIEDYYHGGLYACHSGQIFLLSLTCSALGLVWDSLWRKLLVTVSSAFSSFSTVLRTLVTGGGRHASVHTLHGHGITTLFLLVQTVHSDPFKVQHLVWFEILNPAFHTSVQNTTPFNINLARSWQWKKKKKEDDYKFRHSLSAASKQCQNTTSFLTPRKSGIFCWLFFIPRNAMFLVVHYFYADFALFDYLFVCLFI